MRKLSDTQQQRILRAFSGMDPRPHLEVADLDDLYVDGAFHLDNLRLLMAMLTACEAALLQGEQSKD